MRANDSLTRSLTLRGDDQQMGHMFSAGVPAGFLCISRSPSEHDDARFRNNPPGRSRCVDVHGLRWWFRQTRGRTIKVQPRGSDGTDVCGTGHRDASYRLCRQAVVAVVESADVRSRDDAPRRGRHDRTRDRRVLAEREMCSRAHVVRDVVCEHSVQRHPVHDDEVIEALTSDRPDDSFDVGVLPRRSRRRANGFDVHCVDGGCDVREDGIAIVQQERGRFVLWQRVAKLLCRPSSSGLLGDCHVDDPSAVVREDDEYE
jgi:hypothetical protein